MELVRVAKLTTIDNFRLEDCHYALIRGERVTGDGRNVHAKARGYAYAKTEYVSVRTYLSKNRIRV